jgi:hypothetical protein
MIGAIGLLVTEITTGESFMEQVMLAVKGM